MGRIGRLSACLVLLGLSGCAIYTPYAVERHWFDWNTERQLNCQIEKFDHLPPKVIRVRLMRWGYNIGAAGECPRPVDRGWGSRVFGTPGMNGPRAMWNEVPPTDFAPETMNPPAPAEPLPLIPPAPPADLSEPPGEFGPQSVPTTDRGPSLQPANYQTGQRTRSTANRPVANAGWMFRSP